MFKGTNSVREMPVLREIFVSERAYFLQCLFSQAVRAMVPENVKMADNVPCLVHVIKR